MRIAFVHNRLPGYREPVFKEFSKGLNVTFIITEPPKVNSLAHVVFLPAISVPKLDYEIVPGLKTTLESIRPDLVITTDATYYISHVVHVYCRNKRIPYILWLEQWSPNYHPRHILMRPLERRVIRDAAAVFTLGTQASQYALIMGAHTSRIIKAYNTSPPLPAFDGETESNAKLVNELRILFIGRTERVKGLRTLLSALEILSERSVKYKATIGGTGKYAPKLANLIKNKKLERVHFLNRYISKEEQIQLLRECHLFVLPSERWWAVEAWGLVLNEAMSMGKYIVASSQAGASFDLIANEDDGCMFNAQDAPSLADAFQTAYTTLAASNDEVGRRERYLERFSMDQLVDGLRKTVNFVALDPSRLA